MDTRHVTVTVCRGCCCGSDVKHPDVDHEGNLAVLTHAAQSSGCGVLRVVNCLDECDRSDVVAVRRRLPAGPEIIWLGPLNDPLDVAVLGDWLRRGAPGGLRRIVWRRWCSPSVRRVRRSRSATHAARKRAWCARLCARH
ncbi:MAG: hypothetical protein HOY76_06130 [Streptomyces sp.]|nr:hypothetical protein [Streptomyces sp.]NUR02265.1 hypothetical protein [Streptomyces sp.]